MKSKLKALTIDHLGLKLIALAIAFIMWFVVMNIQDATTTRTIADVDVEMLNGDYILEHGNLYNVTEGETVDIIVKGPRSIVENLNQSSFIATADLSHLSVTNSTIIDVATNDSVSINDARKISITPLNQYVTLSIEEEQEKSIPVRIITTGEVSEGHSLGTPVPTPNMITVKGPESVLENIVEARAVVNVSGAEEDITSDVSVGCIDGYGTAIEKDNISLSAASVSVSIPVYNVKEIPVNVETIGIVRDGFGIRNVNFEPSYITVAGDDDKLDAIDSIDINDIVVSDATSNIEKNIDVQQYLSSDLYVAAGSVNEIAVNVVIERVSETTVRIPKASIKVSGKDSALTYEIDAASIDVKISGFEEDMSGINVSDLSPTLDMTEIGVGEHQVVLGLKDPENCNIVGTYKVKVTVTETTEEDAE